MKRWQWWLVGAALLGAVFALAVVFWPKIVECLERGCCGNRKEEPQIALDVPDTSA